MTKEEEFLVVLGLSRPRNGRDSIENQVIDKIEKRLRKIYNIREFNINSPESLEFINKVLQYW